MPAIQSAGMPLSLRASGEASAVMRGAVVAVEAPGLSAADDAQPCLEVMEQRVGSGEDGLLIDGNPEVGRIGTKSFAEEPGRRNADDGDGVVRDDERRANDGGVGAVLLLPGAVAEHGDGLGVRLVIGGADGAP